MALTVDRIQEIRDAVRAATPGVWREGRVGGLVSDQRHPLAPDPAAGVEDEVQYYGGHLVGESMGIHDRLLISMLQNDAEQLLNAAELGVRVCRALTDWRA